MGLKNEKAKNQKAPVLFKDERLLRKTAFL